MSVIISIKKMSLQIYNSLTKKKETFKPLEKGKVKMYVCGVTVYDYCHVGHARAYVVFDTIRRFLEHLGYEVKHIQNFTDIDDKIIARANELDISITELSDKFTAAYFEDMNNLNIKSTESYPKATKFIKQMQELIMKLIKNGTAYITNDGSVYFSVENIKDYGKLSHKVIEDLILGSRVEVSNIKKNPLDFVLWKASKEDEPAWDSPWGPGRPGWHTECAAMVFDLLGEQIDIHGGGEDLLFPHHENELAQAEALTKKPFAKYWIHNSFVNIKNEKMSKSLKNFFTLREILKKYDGEVVRFFLQRIHYRAPLNFSFEGLDEAKQALTRLHTTLHNISENNPINANDKTFFEDHIKKFEAALADDFNISEAIGVMFDINKHINKINAGTTYLKKCGDVLGLFYNLEQDDQIPAEIIKLAEERKTAKVEKNFTKADELRDNIKKAGYIIEDIPEGFRIKKL